MVGKEKTREMFIYPKIMLQAAVISCCIYQQGQLEFYKQSTVTYCPLIFVPEQTRHQILGELKESSFPPLNMQRTPPASS